MSSKESTGSEQQFEQQSPPRREAVRLDQRYKTIGIAAVTAATVNKKAKKKTDTTQMS